MILPAIRFAALLASVEPRVPGTPPAPDVGAGPRNTAPRDTAPPAVGAAGRGVVLFLMPAADTQRLANGRLRPTGYFLNEFYEPYRALREARYAVAFASPGARRPAVDPESLKPHYRKAHPERLAEARALADTLAALRAPQPLAAARRGWARYAGVVVPGGQGVMVDLLGDTVAHAILRDVGRAGRPVGLICHAPALLTRLGPESNPFLGRRVTSVSRLEEWYIERVVMKGAARDRGIARALARSGYRHRRALGPARPYAVRDGNLVTSQNPFSGARFTALYLEALREAAPPAPAVGAASGGGTGAPGPTR